MIFDVGSASHPGQARTSTTDHCSVAQHWVTDAQLAEKGRLFVVADSLGQDASDVDSRHAVNRLYQLYYTYPSSNVRESLQRAISRVGVELYEESIRHQRPKRVMLVAAVLLGTHAYLINVGQTQAFVYHAEHLTALTPARAWDEIIPSADLPEAEREKTPAHVLGWSRVALSDSVHRHLALNDILLLCSDGLHQAVSNAETAQLAAQAAHAQELADQLVSLAVQRGATSETPDAATAVAIRATAKGKGGGPFSLVASWVLWGVLGVAIVAGVLGLLSLTSPSSRTQPTATLTLSPTAVRLDSTPTLTLPAILKPTATPPATTTSTRAASTPTKRPTSRPQPTNTASRATPTSSHTPSLALYDAPKVIAPYTDEPVYLDENNSFVWQWFRQLTAEESFEVRIWKEGATPPERGSIRTGAQQQRFWLPGEQTGKYFWDVLVVKTAGAQVQPISLRSEPRSFWWMGPRPAKPTDTPHSAPPTHTPVPPTNTPAPPTDTPVPPTNTPAPPTDTPVPPTPTPLP